MPHVVCAKNDEEFDEVLTRIRDIWDEEPTQEDILTREICFINPPSAMIAEFEEMGYTVSRVRELL